MSRDRSAEDQKTGQEIVIRHARELETLSDQELLGEDYAGWLKARKKGAHETLASGAKTRGRAERAIDAADAAMRARAKLIDGG